MNENDNRLLEEEPKELTLVENFNNTIMGIAMLVFSIIGSVVSFLLLDERIKLWQNIDHTTACDINPWVSCGAVMESWQASTFGFPNILLGTTLFPALAMIAIVLLLNGSFSRKVWYFIETGTTFAFLFIGWLYYSAVYSIGVLCPYCMIVWAVVIPLSVMVFTRNRIAEQSTPQKFKQALKNWWWAIIIVIYCAVAGSIVIMFPYAFNF